MYKQIFLTNVMRILEELNMTKKELSEKSGISPSFISELTSSDGNPSLRVLEDIANALDVPLSILLESSDMDEKDLQQLSGNNNHNNLLPGYRLVCAYLSEYQAFEVKQLDVENRRRLREKLKKDRKIVKKLRH